MTLLITITAFLAAGAFIGVFWLGTLIRRQNAARELTPLLMDLQERLSRTISDLRESTSDKLAKTQAEASERLDRTLAQNRTELTTGLAATTAAEPAAAAQTDPLDFTDEEVEVLQQLAKRREELELHARQLDEREAMVAAAEQRMEQKMAELRALQSTVEDLLAKRSEQEEADLLKLVQTYEKMKPKDAAAIFEEMDMDLLRDLVSRMKVSRAAPILALVSPTKVKELTLELAQKNALPFQP